ncbi:MAG: hypothetical protein LBD29_03870 [Treponema sp.]|nr:hypothetical protein [Treponema sp.]
MHTLKLPYIKAEQKEGIRTRVLNAGFCRARFLVPFDPQVYTDSGRPVSYQAGSPALLVAALVYGNQQEVMKAETASSANPAGYIAPFAQRNYYREAVKRLQGLARELRSDYGGKKSDFNILCNSPVPEKPLAVASGLGSIGRNSLIIIPEAGSLCIIAAMTLPFALEGDPPLTGSEVFPYCRSCDTRLPPCAAACPTRAVTGDGSIDLSRCIQWYASGKGNTVPEEIAQNWGNRLYGCTDCQDQCVHNMRPIQGLVTEEGVLPGYIDPQKLLTMTEAELKARFKGTSLGFSWLIPQGIRRNACMILGQYQRQQ